MISTPAFPSLLSFRSAPFSTSLRVAILALLCLPNFSAAQDNPADKLISEGRLLLPAGTLEIDQPLEIDLSKTGPLHIVGQGHSRIVMNGPGPAIRITGTLKGTAAPKTIKPQVFEKENAPLIAGFEIIGNHPEADGIELVGVMQPTIRDLTIRKSRHAIRLTSRNRNLIVSDCHLYENSGAGVYFDHVSLHQANIVGSHISYNAAGGVVIRGGDVRNVHISGCDIEANMGTPDAPAAANVLLDSEEGSIGEVAITGCTIQHTHHGKDSANIWIDLQSNRQKFTEELRHGNVTISGNILSDVQHNIYVQNTRGVAITGNTIWKGYDRNILLKNCEAVVVSGNTFDRNPRYGYGDASDAKLGIRLTQCSGCLLVANAINGVGDVDGAIELHRCSQIVVSQSTIRGFPKAGVLLDECVQSIVNNCIVTEENAAAEAIRQLGGEGNRIVENMVIETP
ncbi:hypothetical protein CA51_45430 [Rosistilla oblonga]|uniref:right-handed parallel beta-helix repeat-containing protein n=1 Tax=Rosistilla oblonga TaxID=2527990 RepID=UPI00118C616B|nr:right-handed parallel beta-helix repeat-containing protein [Rosistilla oblonga]QDV14635.1 hypothetical protein CA51_45430 [Rosistilla oblonga]